MRSVRWAMLIGVVLFHFVVLAFNLAAILILPFSVPWYVALPLISLLVNLILSPTPCPLTKLESRIRRSLELPDVRHFVGHYIVWPIKKKMRNRKIYISQENK
jgi:hypothetical protein